MTERLSIDGSAVLVVGGAGFVGSNLVRRLLADDAASVVVIDNLLSSEATNIPADARVSFVEGSIADDTILDTVTDDFDFIFHLATYHGNQSSIADPLADHEHNQLTTLKLFERIKEFRRLRKVVYSGAGCAVAEKTAEAPHATTEDVPVSLRMDSPYSISKIVGEFYAVYYHDRHKLPTVRARFQNVFGPGEILGAGEWRGTPATVWRNVTPTFIYKAIKREALPVEGDGSASRDFIFVGDICDGLVRCALRGDAGDVYNLASGVETPIIDLANRINELTNNTTPIEYRPARAWDHSGRRFGSITKSSERLGFRAATPLKKGLAETVDWTTRNLGLIEQTIDRHRGKLVPA